MENTEVAAPIESGVSTNEITDEQVDDFFNESNEDEQVEEAVEDNQEQEQISDELDLSDVDLSDFGITDDMEQIEQQEAPQQQEADTNQQMMQSILEKLNTPQEQQEQREQLSEEEASAVKDLFGKFEELGLIPKGMTEEQANGLKMLEEMVQEKQQAKEMEAQQAEFNGKVNAVEEYSKSLESLIPGYNSEFMAQAVAQINAKNPEAGQRILNNPTELTKIWAKIGHKAQPKQQGTNVLHPQTKSVNENEQNGLYNKVNSGTATEDEEARLMAML